MDTWIEFIWNILNWNISLWITGGTDNYANGDNVHQNSEYIIIGEDENITTTQGPDLPIPLFKHAMVSINNTLSMVIGGLSSDLFKESALTFWYDNYL